MSLFGLPLRIINRLAPVAPPLVSSVRDWIDDTGGGYYKPLFPAAITRYNPPFTIDKEYDVSFVNNMTLTIPERYLAIVHNITIRGPDGFLILPDGRYCTETSPFEWLKPHPAYRQRMQKHPRKTQGKFFTLLSMHCREYYHWLLDVLPRLHGVMEHLPADIRFLIPNHLKDYQKETLERVGVPAERWHEYDPADPLCIEELWYAPLGAPDRYQAPQAIPWLRQRLAGMVPIHSAAGGTKRLFISRASAPSRCLVNEQELRVVLDTYQFEMVYPEKLSFDDQIRLFQSAEAVLGAHGAGFSNILFSPPGTRIMEIFPERVGFRTYYWALANACCHVYGYTNGESLPCEKGPEFADLRMCPAKLSRFLHAAFQEMNH